MIIKNFTDIKLSLKALNQVINNQINHSQISYLMASDIQLSIDFVDKMKELLIIMENLFGDLLERTEMIINLELENGEIIDIL